jgi:phosphoglycerate kinase
METAIRSLVKTIIYRVFITVVTALAFVALGKDPITAVGEIPDGWMGMDIGPASAEAFRKVILGAKTILWNGPMGVFEMPSFEMGTKQMALAIAEATKNGSYSLIGGGDSVAAINQYHLADQVSYVSTGGGALLEYIESGSLPGVEAVKNNQ